MLATPHLFTSLLSNDGVRERMHAALTELRTAELNRLAGALDDTQMRLAQGRVSVLTDLVEAFKSPAVTRRATPIGLYETIENARGNSGT